MKNMKYLAIFAGIALFAAVTTLVITTSPMVALMGKLAIAASLMGLAATATAYVIDQYADALAMGDDVFHWY